MGSKALARGRKAAAVEAGPVEGPWDLPDGWRWLKLGSVVEILDYIRRPINGDERAERIAGKARAELFPYFGATGQAGWIDDYHLEGDHILLGEDGAPFLDRGASKAYAVSGKFWVNNHAHILKANSNVAHRYLLHALNSLDYAPFVNGTTRLKLTQAAMRDMPLPIPEPAVQVALAARIDALFAEIDEGKAALARARAGVETYAKALLKAAVTGELTADWRAANPPEETGEQLLARILADRRARWHADPKNARKTYTEPAGPDTDGLPELPEGWAWASLGQVSFINPPVLFPVTGSVPFVPMAAVEAESGRVSLDQYRPVSEVKSGFTRFATGDVLFAKITPCMENGKIAIVPPLDGDVGAGSTEFHVLRPHGISSQYLWAFLVQPVTREKAARNMTGTAGQMRVPRNYLEQLPIPVPPVFEQDEIVRLVGSIGSDVATRLRDFSAIGSGASTLRQSILAAAFRGELAA